MGSEKRSRGLWRPVVLIGAVILVLVFAKYFGAGDKISLLRDWVDSLGPLGPLVYTGMYIIAVVAALPGSDITDTR